MDRVLEHLAQWKPFRAMVIGDAMLDELVYGHADRLSADAPVPVLHVQRAERSPGGAANVCRNLRALRGEVVMVGLVGDDPEGAHLRRALEEDGVDASGLVVDATRPTTVKRNLIGLAQQRHAQKMFRVDVESREPVAGAARDGLLAAVRERLADVDVVCLEDYAKGVCTDEVCRAVIEMARSAGKPVFVDPPASGEWSRYAGATSITPNRNEAERATGISTSDRGAAEHHADLAERLMTALGVEAVVLTLDRHGALLLERASGAAVPVPTVARDVYDVTGAGDMMLAALAAARANGMDWADAVRLANAAAGLEVEVFGVKPIPLEMLHHRVLLERSGLTGKVRTLEHVLVEVEARRNAGERIVFTNGCFDVLHPGHVMLMDKCAALGDFLVVGLNSDASVRRLKGDSRPINSEHDRAAVLAGLGSVGAVVVFGEDTPMRLIEAIKPDVLVKGGDYTPDTVVGGAEVEAWGGRVEIVPLMEGKSSTATIARMR